MTTQRKTVKAGKSVSSSLEHWPNANMAHEESGDTGHQETAGDLETTLVIAPKIPAKRH